MRIQLWSYNYDPEPTGIGPLSTVWAGAMQDRGHDVSVVAAHAHYPSPEWGRPMLPRREIRDGIPTVRLPLWAGRHNTAARLRQELTYTAALAAAAPFLKRPDVIVAVSPSFPALLPTLAATRLRGVPWVLWLQDILPDGATATGLLDDGLILRASLWLEQRAYRSARRIVVISDSFAVNLRRKGVPEERITRIFNPATQSIQPSAIAARVVDPKLVLTMGNIGHTQNLVHVARAFESSSRLADIGARLVIAGDGVAAADVRAAVTTDRVTITGVLDRPELERYLRRAAIALVSQQHGGTDFNVPSKLMNFMGFGLPTFAAVRRDSEVARIITQSHGGWVSASEDPDELSSNLFDALTDATDQARRGERALAYARANFAPERIARQFDQVLYAVLEGRATGVKTGGDDRPAPADLAAASHDGPTGLDR